jgi:choline dehydrogenase-like flavoprotein
VDLDSQFDVIVVGSGAGGAAVAWRLCNLGMLVLILEAGPRFDPATDYPLVENDWERRGFPAKPGSQAKLSFGDLGSLTPDIPELRSWNRVSGRPG